MTLVNEQCEVVFDTLVKPLQQLSLALLESTDLSTTIQVLNDSLLNDFQADAVVICLLISESQLSELNICNVSTVRTLAVDDEAYTAFSGVINGGKPLCGHLRHRQISYLFGEGAKDNIASAAVVALNTHGTDSLKPRCLGLLGIGSRDAKRYHAGIATQFLSYLGELVGRSMGRYMPMH